MSACLPSHIGARRAIFRPARGFSSKAQALRDQRTTVDVAVIGGGIVGSATARALARRGVSVALLEQNTLTSGTTWHAAGLVGTMKASSLVQKMAIYGRDLYSTINDDVTGSSLVGWEQTGSLGIARCNDSMEQFTRQVQQARAMGITQHRLVTPEEIKEIHPFLNLHGGDSTLPIVGGAYSPLDGIVNPGDVAMHLAKDAREHGAIILEQTECIGFEMDESRRSIHKVRTDTGMEITCGHVCLAGGAWMKELSRSAFGENRIPVAMMPHQYIIFDKADGIGNHLPVVRDIHHKYYLKPEVGGFMVGIFEGEPVPHLPDVVRARNSGAVSMPRSAEHEVYESSYEKAGKWLEACMEDVPLLNEVGLKQWLHGPDTHSPDHSFIIGQMPGAANVYVATGFNSQGITAGPAAGVALSEFILDGTPHSLGADFSEADPSRTFPGLAKDADWVEARAAENYGKVYAVHFPYEIFESARCRRLMPLHERLKAAGAVFGEAYGWERPLYFPRPEERVVAEHSPYADESVPMPAPNAFSFRYRETEYFAAERREAMATRNAAALFNMSSFGKLRVSGPKSLEVLQHCMTAEMDKPLGVITYSLFCHNRGGVLGDLTVTRVGPEEFYLVTLTPQPAKLADHLKNCFAELGASPQSCVVTDETEAKAVLALNGPNSRAVLSPLADVPLDNESFAPGTAQQLCVAGVDVFGLRVSFAGELGWELHVAAEHAVALYDKLMAAGEAHGIVNGGVFALLNVLRTEKGFIHYGADVAMTETPLEVGLAFACKLKPEQPDFIGKSAIVQQRKVGWTKRLVSVKASADADVDLWGHETELLYRNGELVGSLTSGAYSHFLGCPIGMGIVNGPPKVPQSWLREGNFEVEATVRGADGRVELRKVPVEVSTKCLVDVEGARVRG